MKVDPLLEEDGDGKVKGVFYPLLKGSQSKFEFVVLRFHPDNAVYPSLPAICETWLIVRHSTLARLGRCHVDYFLFSGPTCD